MPVTAIGLGTNIGNRLLNLRTALRFLVETPLHSSENRLIRTSNVFETKPWGVPDQPYFLNACLIMEYMSPTEDLLARIKEIESEMGRKVTRRWGERKIDIDILMIDSMIYDSPNLNIPHVEMHRRNFVLIPLAQIAPHWVHPCTKRTISEMASDFQSHDLTLVCSL